MSFLEDCGRFGDQLAKLVEAGVAVKDAAAALGISRSRGYAILRATGRPVGTSHTAWRDVDPAAVVAVFTATNSINQAAKVNGISCSRARCVLVEHGLVSRDRQPRGKAEARTRFTELMDAGWSASAAAHEVGVHERTARDWRDGIRKVGNTRVYSDGTVVDYASGTRYTQTVKTTAGGQHPASERASVSRYLQLADRLVIADGLTTGLSYTAIAEKIGRDKSTVSREVAAHRVAGLYLPYQAEAAAAAARARPKQSKLVSNQKLRQVVTDGLSNRWSPEEISHRLVKDFRTTRVCG